MKQNIIVQDGSGVARDMDIVRNILLWAERGGLAAECPDVDRAVLAEHCQMMIDAGLLKGIVEIKMVASYASPNPTPADRIIGQHHHGRIRITGITWDGYELLDTIRLGSVWGEIKDFMRENNMPASVRCILHVAQRYLQWRKQKSDQ